MNNNETGFQLYETKWFSSFVSFFFFIFLNQRIPVDHSGYKIIILWDILFVKDNKQMVHNFTVKSYIKSV